MKATFIGGGSLRLLPILRGLFKASPQTLEGAELRFFDLHADRAQAVIALLQHSPEFKAVKNCRLVCPETLEEALTGIDLCYITMGIRRAPINALAWYASEDGGVISSDQLSLTGAFWGVLLGRIVYNIAGKLSKLSPDALMLIFANPVAVYSSMVERFLGVRSLGICGGYPNHRYDLTRFFGRNGFEEDCHVVAAGVNHLSFILRGTYKGEDLYRTALPQKMKEGWKNIFEPGSIMYDFMELMHQTYLKHKYLIFSGEIDGLFHLAPEKFLAQYGKVMPERSTYDPVADTQTEKRNVEKSFSHLLECAGKAADLDWRNMDHPLFAVNDRDIFIPIARAFANEQAMRITASGLNKGVLAGLPDHAAVEYTLEMAGNKITPVEDQYIPEPFTDLVSSLSEFQTLLGEAIARNDCRIFAQALEAYPFYNKDTVLKHLDIFKDLLDNNMQKTANYLK